MTGTTTQVLEAGTHTALFFDQKNGFTDSFVVVKKETTIHQWLTDLGYIQREAVSENLPNEGETLDDTNCHTGYEKKEGAVSFVLVRNFTIIFTSSVSDMFALQIALAPLVYANILREAELRK